MASILSLRNAVASRLPAHDYKAKELRTASDDRCMNESSDRYCSHRTTRTIS